MIPIGTHVKSRVFNMGVPTGTVGTVISHHNYAGTPRQYMMIQWEGGGMSQGWWDYNIDVGASANKAENLEIVGLHPASIKDSEDQANYYRMITEGV